MTQQLTFKEFLENPPFPRTIQFETNTYCNANCLMCPHDKMKRRGTAKWSLLTKIIRESASRVEVAIPFLMQEPMLEPRLVSILANLKQHNPKITTIVYTNMAILPDGVMEQIIKLGLLDNLDISFYGPTEELYKKWQPPLNREQTIQNIKKVKLLRDKLKRTKPKITLHVISIPEIIKAIPHYNDVVAYVDQICNVQFDTFHGDIPDYGGNQEVYLGRPPSPRTPCQRLWGSMIVHFDGSVVPCCIDYDDEHVMGNVTESSLDEVWNSLKFQKFRLMHLQKRWNEIPMCRKCRVHEYQFSKEWVTYWLNGKLTPKS